MSPAVVDTLLWALITVLLALPATAYVLLGIGEPTLRRALLAFVVDTSVIAILFWIRIRLVSVSLVLGAVIAALVVSNVYLLGRAVQERRRRHEGRTPGRED